MPRVTRDFKIIYNILGGGKEAEIEKKTFDLMLSPLNTEIVKAMAEGKEGISLPEMKAKINPVEVGLSDSYDIAELLRLNLQGLMKENIITMSDGKYLLTEDGKKIYSKMLQIIKPKETA